MSGYNLIELDTDKWILQVIDGDIFGGTFKETILFAATRFGFAIEEIEIAIQEMVAFNHNAVHFGMNKTFIYTFIQELSSYKKAG